SLPELAELPAEPGAWIGAISLGEAGRISDQLLDLVRSWIAGVVGGVTKVRDSFRRGLIEPSLTLHRLRPYQSFSNRTAQRDPRSGCMPIPRPPTILSRGDNWTMAARRLSLGSVRFIWMPLEAQCGHSHSKKNEPPHDIISLGDMGKQVANGKVIGVR